MLHSEEDDLGEDMGEQAVSIDQIRHVPWKAHTSQHCGTAGAVDLEEEAAEETDQAEGGHTKDDNSASQKDNLNGARERGENQDEVPGGVGHKKDDLLVYHNLPWEEAVELAAAADCREIAAAAAVALAADAVVVAVENRQEVGAETEAGAGAGAAEDETIVVVVMVVVEVVVDAVSDAKLHSAVHLAAEAALAAATAAASVAADEEHVVAVVGVAAVQVAEEEDGAVAVEGQ